MGSGRDSLVDDEAAASDFSDGFFHGGVMACILDFSCVLTFWSFMGMTREAAKSQQHVIVMDQKQTSGEIA